MPNDNRPVPITHSDMLSSIDRRVTGTERRPSVTAARQLLGPGFGPYAVQTFDWNAAELNFNGYFWSDLGVANSPDPTRQWVGTVVASVQGSGHMEVWEHGVLTSGQHWTRDFATLLGSVSYGPWVRVWPTPARASGVATLPILDGASVGTVAVTFPADRFTVNPMVTVGLNSSTVSWILRFSGKTTAGMTIGAYAKDVGQTQAGDINLTVNWIAEEPS